MEKLSRVKKYEDLRKNIDTGIHEDQNNKQEAYDSQMSDISASIFKKMKLEEEPVHTPEREKITRITEPEHPANDFQNEYLDDFLNEVKQYNLKKGTRECEDTQIDILHQLNSNRPTRSHYVEDIQEEKAAPTPSIEDMVNTMSNEDIAKEVKSLLDDTAKQPVYEAPIAETPMYARREAPQEAAYETQKPQPQMPYQEPVQEEVKYREPTAPAAREYAPVNQTIPSSEDSNSYEQEMKREKMLHQKLVEETQQLRRQLDEYEDELTDLSDGVEKNNRILNVILCCLILALLGVIAFVIIMLVKAGGTL